MMKPARKRVGHRVRPVRVAKPDNEDALMSFANILEKSQAAVNQFDVPVEGFARAGDSDDDGDVDSAAHKRLVSALGQLHRGQHIKVPTRTEISERRGEFDLVKSHSEDVVKPLEAKVTLDGLVNSLNKNKKHSDVSKELVKLQKTTKKLAKPLEKPVAERLARSLAYEKAVSELDRWEAVVEKNKVEETINFPLIDHEAVKLATTTPRQPMSYRIKSDLMSKLEKMDPVAEPVTQSEKAARNQRLKEELRDQRKDLARLRRKESYEIEKAKRQNKIKSKKYHKVMKKEKLKKKLAEFEELRKVDPEAVLVELEKIEKARVEERAHQRHRNTGTWAKNLQVRAKFDKEAREELTQQIEIGRELKRKQGDQEESSEDDDDQEDEELDGSAPGERNPFNPWMKSEGSNQVEDSFSGYRKYWETRNENDAKMKEFQKDEEGSDGDSEQEDNEDEGSSEETSEDTTNANIEFLDNGFEVQTLDNIFEPLEDADAISEKVSDKLQKLRRATGGNQKQNNVHKSSDERPKNQLEFKKKSKLSDRDEQMEERAAGQDAQSQAKDYVKSLRKLLTVQTEDENKAQQSTEEQINPNKFMAMQPRQLKTALPDAWNDEDLDEDADDEVQRMTIAEAFEDDDIVLDFKQEKEDKVKSEQPQDINLTLPGWGSWTGVGVSEPKPSKRMILKFQQDLPRKDDHKEKLILNESVSEKLKGHLVNELPFPFRSVGDYESSIRAPVTRSFVPETAHRALTKPSITTRMGKIIHPMDEQTLLQSETPVGKRKLKSTHKLVDAKKKKKTKL